MKQRRAALLLLVVIAMPIAYVVWQYHSRPFFTTDFRFIGWGPPRQISYDHHEVFIDPSERVLLVVGITPNGDTEWVPYCVPVGPRLRIKRLDRDEEKELEWRPGNIILVSSSGDARYSPLSRERFNHAMSDSTTILPEIQKVVGDAEAAAGR